MIQSRLELALERLGIGDWARFERLASAFLAAEFDSLRTVASASGDEGRDSELFSPNSEPSVVAQYSISADWRQKIRSTTKRIAATLPDARILIYVSNSVIGAAADELKKTLRSECAITLDVRDRNWFLERVMASTQRQAAAEELATAVVDPLLASSGVGPYVRSTLTTPETIAAVTFLGLQWQDDIRDKGLTRIAFESIVRACLVGTDANNRVTRESLYAKVAQILPDHSPKTLKRHVDSAVHRLTKSAVKQFPADEICLAYEEVLRFDQYRVASAIAEIKLSDAIREITSHLPVDKSLSSSQEDEFRQTLREATDAIIFDHSQAFAMAVSSGTTGVIADSDFRSIVIQQLARKHLPKLFGVDWINLLQTGVREILTSANPAIQAHMRSLADSYTLLAFLKQTPDVQSAVEKLFSHGVLWLDATIILPLIAEMLYSGEGEIGRFTRMHAAALDAGLKLYVTPGIIEEIERHMNRSLTCARYTGGQWEGSIPYLLERYVSAGRARSAFANWLENFRGEQRPLTDLSEYLSDEFQIEERPLDAECAAAPQGLRYALQEIWHERHVRRRERYGTPLDDMTITKLVNHDVECYAGVVQMRQREKPSPFGYSAWWLTVDRQAFNLKAELHVLMGEAPPDSPVLSADFLVNYLAFGPNRRRVAKSAEAHLPVLMIMGAASQFTTELLGNF